MIKRDGAGRDGVFQHGMQVAAMDMNVSAAEAALARRVEHDLVHRRAGVPGAADILPRFDAGRDQRVLEAEAAQHFRGVGGKNYSGADARERRRLLVDFDGKAGALQKAGGGQAAKPGADHRNALMYGAAQFPARSVGGWRFAFDSI